MAHVFWKLLVVFQLLQENATGQEEVSNKTKNRIQWKISAETSILSLSRPVVEFVDVLDVPEDDIVLVAEAGRDVFGAAGHLPQVRLEKTFPFKQLIEFNLHDLATSLESSCSLNLKTDLDAFL